MFIPFEKILHYYRLYESSFSICISMYVIKHSENIIPFFYFVFDDKYDDLTLTITQQIMPNVYRVYNAFTFNFHIFMIQDIIVDNCLRKM